MDMYIQIDHIQIGRNMNAEFKCTSMGTESGLWLSAFRMYSKFLANIQTFVCYGIGTISQILPEDYIFYSKIIIQVAILHYQHGLRWL